MHLHSTVPALDILTPYSYYYSSQIVLDAEGKEHLLMRFYVEGPDNEGTAHLEMIKDQRGKWEYKYLFVDIPGKRNKDKFAWTELKNELPF